MAVVQRFYEPVYWWKLSVHKTRAHWGLAMCEKLGTGVLKFRLTHQTSSTKTKLVVLGPAYCTSQSQCWTIFADSALSLQTMMTYRIVQLWNQSTHKVHQIAFRRVASHCDVPRNEMADVATKSTHSILLPISTNLSRPDWHWFYEALPRKPEQIKVTILTNFIPWKQGSS